MRIGATELLVIFALALLVIGPDRLPEFAKKLGEAMGQFKTYSSKVAKDIQETVIDPMEEAAAPVREAVKPIEEMDKTIRDGLRDVEKSFSDLGKPSAKKPEGEKPKAEPAASQTTAPAGQAEKSTDTSKEEEET